MPAQAPGLPPDTPDQSDDGAHDFSAAGCELSGLADTGGEQNSPGPGSDDMPDESLPDDACGGIPPSVAPLGNGIDWGSIDWTASVPSGAVGWLEETDRPDSDDSDVGLLRPGNLIGQSPAVTASGASLMENAAVSGSDSVVVGPLAPGIVAIDEFSGNPADPRDSSSPVSSRPAGSQGADQAAGTGFPRELPEAETESVASRNDRQSGGLRFGQSEPNPDPSEREQVRRQLVVGDSATATARDFQSADGRGFTARESGDRWTRPDRLGPFRGVRNDALYTPDLVLSATLDLLTAVSASFSGPQDAGPLPGRREWSLADADRPQPRQLLSAVDKPAFSPAEGASEGSRDARISAASGRTLQNSQGPASSQPPVCRGSAELELTARDDGSNLPVTSDHTVRGRLLHVIEPRGPPQDEGSLCPDIGSQAHSDLLERLKFSISPRGPSLTPAFDAEFASVPSRSRR